MRDQNPPSAKKFVGPRGFGDADNLAMPFPQGVKASFSTWRPLKALGSASDPQNEHAFLLAVA